MELVTRVSVEELGPEEGFLREAPSSLHTFFNTTSDIPLPHADTGAAGAACARSPGRVGPPQVRGVLTVREGRVGVVVSAVRYQ